MITSTHGLYQAGAKKWVTVVRSGCFIPAKMIAAGMELVLEATMASGDTRSSIIPNIFFLRGMLSVAASMISSASEMAS
ncbi:MAG: hypothetical protein BWY79_02225 [Actinobacteria bacterium ADurb.Bin444]|nr:MAG: hypothetical protein BWY79_02225 [Actinobacteria bacterium ADurb.Bin444]